jgi:serine/threonine-protein kinase CTR1
MILYNMLTTAPPWPELSGPEAVKLAALKLGRPSIPRHWDAKLAELLRSCWVNDPAARPSFAAVLEVLHDVFKLAIGATYEDVTFRKRGSRGIDAAGGCCVLS